MSDTYIIFLFGVLLSAIGGLIVIVLNGIKSEIAEIKTQLEKIESDLHRRVTDVERRHQEVMVDHDRRISKIEARCEVSHRNDP